MTSKYKYVCKHNPRRISSGAFTDYWVAQIKGDFKQTFKTEREAALAIDKHLISQGKQAVNILKKIEE